MMTKIIYFTWNDYFDINRLFDICFPPFSRCLSAAVCRISVPTMWWKVKLLFPAIHSIIDGALCTENNFAQVALHFVTLLFFCFRLPSWIFSFMMIESTQWPDVDRCTNAAKQTMNLWSYMLAINYSYLEQMSESRGLMSAVCHFFCAVRWKETNREPSWQYWI